jgi:matrixin
MTRVLLVVLALLVSLLVLARLRRPASSAADRVAVTATARPPSSSARAVPPPPPPPPPPPGSGAPDGASTGSRTPAIDILARAAARSRLSRASAFTYFDSVFAETDSVVRRWPDPQGVPLTVAVAFAEPQPALEAAMRGAIAAWEDVGPDFRFSLINDTSTAQIVVRTRPKPAGEAIGETTLQWTRDGGILSAAMIISQNGPDEKPLPAQTLLAVVTHEFGHVLGLGHSPDPGDVMFASARAVRPSERDRATLSLLYELPLGYIREPSSR